MRRALLADTLHTLQRALRDLPKTVIGCIARRGSRVAGTRYEKQTARTGARRLKEALKLEKIELVYQPEGPGQKDMDSITDLALHAGAITQEENLDLRQANLVFVAIGDDKRADNLRWILAEVKETITLDQVTKTRRRANIIAKATAFPCIPVVMGVEITPEARAELKHDVMAIGINLKGQTITVTDTQPEGSHEFDSV